MQLFKVGVLAAAVLGACCAAAAAKVPRVVTDMPVVHALVTQVMGDLGPVDLLLDRGGDVHSYQMRPSQAQALAAADVVFWVGPELTPWLVRVRETLAPQALSVPLLEVPGLALIAADEDHDHDHDHGHDHDHDHAHGAAHDDTPSDVQPDAAESHDPHAWLDPQIAQQWLKEIARVLSERDSAHAAQFHKNADLAMARIATLSDRLQARLAPVKVLPFLVYHDAYGYFARAFDLRLMGALALSDAQAPSAERLTALRADMQSDGVVCLFPEAQHDPQLAVSVIEGTTVRVGGMLDPSGSTLTPGAGLYEMMMQALAAQLLACLAP